jgi:hypothetical protein
MYSKSEQALCTVISGLIFYSNGELISGIHLEYGIVSKKTYTNYSFACGSV